MRQTSQQVIIGASAAGVSAALAMRRVGYDGRITLVDADPNLPYERPPLSKTLIGAGNAALKPIVPEQTYEDLSIELRLGVTVSSLDPGKRRVELRGGEVIAADHVILTPGVGARRLNVPGIDLENVMLLRDAADAGALSERLSAGGPLVIIGAGFIGLELAALARENGTDVTVVEMAPLPLFGPTGEVIAQLVRQLHVDRGVRFCFRSTVAQFVGASAVEAVVLDSGDRLPAATVVVGVGVVPRVDLARAAGVEVDGFGIVVDAFGNTSDPWVSAAGDVASQPHPQLESPCRVEHWDVAVQHGTAVGATVVGQATAYRGVLYAWSEQFGLTMQILGRPRPTDEFVMRRGYTPERFVGFWLREEHLVAVLAQDMARDIGAAKRLIESDLGVPKSQLENPDVDLRKLVKELATTG